MTAPSTSGIVPDPTLYLPRPARILEVRDLTARERFFRVALPEPLQHRPGQFVMLSRPGIGEAPISISNGPRGDNILEMVIRKAGSLTGVLHTLKVGDWVGVRGPFGSGFPLAEFQGMDLLFVAGGLGLVPLRSLIQPVLAEAHRYGTLTLICGFRSPAEELYREDLQAWGRQARVLRLVNETASLPWDGGIGLVTDPLATLPLDPARTLAILCGPPVMYKFVITGLDARNVPHDHIFVDLERRMKCGVGKCGHCQINQVYCCQEGPVFRFSAIGPLREALS
ncbi:MAG: FAD/NAD(P)-binding protein [Magnetococcales bacterium]|nr:FAD/NAD(P)-binding protein [Magnetococcales bacterium]